MIGVLRANRKALGAAGGSSAPHGRTCAGKRPVFSPTASVRDWWHLGLLLGALLLASACATPIGAAPGDRQSVYRALTSNVLSSGELSATTQQVLLRLGLAERFEEEPEAVLAELRGSGSDLSRDQLSALAELSFAYADKSQKQEYYLAAAVYAYAFLLPADKAQAPRPVDPRNRLAAVLYNLGLTLGLKTPVEYQVDIEAGKRPLPFGTLELTIDPKDFVWGGYRMSRFVPMAEFEVRGLRNRYRQPGVGVPLAAVLTPTGEGAAAEAARKRIPPRIRVPVTAFVRIENVEEGIASGTVRGRIELYPADQATSVEVGGLEVPLELEPTAALAYQLEGAPVWDTEIAGFLHAQRPVFGDGLGMMRPYRPGRIPVVFIHGTASSPARWAEMVNELDNDPVLRERVQFWFFNYNTSQPIVVSAKQLRDALTSAVTELDPDGRDLALHHMVLIGHSQGGLLARLMVTDSGTRFWDNVSKVPVSELKVTPEMRELLESTMFFMPLPFVDSCDLHRYPPSGQLSRHRRRARRHPVAGELAGRAGEGPRGHRGAESRRHRLPRHARRAQTDPDGGGQHESGPSVHEGARGQSHGRRCEGQLHRGRAGRRAPGRARGWRGEVRQRASRGCGVGEGCPFEPLDAG